MQHGGWIPVQGRRHGVRSGGDLALADLAREASSKAIRESVTSLFDDETVAKSEGAQFGLLDEDKFKAACEDEGFEF